MKINHQFYNYLKPYLLKLQEKVGEDFVVFGSAPLYLLGVVPFSGNINDLDVNLKNESQIPADAVAVTFHKNVEQKLYKIVIDDLEIDMGVNWPGYGDFFSRISHDPIVIDGFKFANLDMVEEWKSEMVSMHDRQKYKDYLEAIHKYKKSVIM